MKSEVITRVRGFILEDLGWDGSPDTLTEDYPLIVNKVVDSLGIVQMVTTLEDEFAIEVDDDELTADNFATLGQIADLVVRKRADA